MSIGAARVMAAGKAGLESLPYFVDELLAQGIPQLAPWAIDHSQDQIDDLRDMTQVRVAGDWQSLYGIGISPPGITMETDSAGIHHILELLNPEAAKATELADSPARLGAWCRRQIDQYCRDTENLWERYKSKEGLTASYHLAVVIPFCPEGPTSGTVGMYLGAALRRYFAERNKSDQLVVWGIELCPPVDKGDAGEPDRMAVQNAFRGYVARQELLQGVPLSGNPDDDNRYQPFDINIVFDGGKAESALASREEVWSALDRAAAQVAACLLNGAGGGDKPEATVQLKQGQRWNAYLAHVVSERSYNQACRYLSYRLALPWHRDRDAWNAATPADRRDAFLRRIDGDIIPRLSHEKNDAVKKRVDDLVTLAENLRAISLRRKWNDILTRNHKEALNQVDFLLNQAVSDDEHNYEESRRAGQITGNVIARDDLFCINIVLPEKQRVEAATIARDSGIPGPIADVLGASGVSAVRNKITNLCKQVLERTDCNDTSIDSQALYDEMMSISIGDWSKTSNNEQFSPTRENLRYFIAADRRSIPGSFSELRFDLSNVVRTAPTSADSPAEPASINWKLGEVDHDIPVEYSILTLGRVRNGDGFRDISTHGELERIYLDLTADRERWREHARYYGVKPPPDLLPDAPPAAGPSMNGQPAHSEMVRDRA